MLMIRLQRVGRKNDPAFRVVVTDRRHAAKSGKFLTVVGAYDPKEKRVRLDGDRIKHWLSVGAKASATVHNLLIKHKIITGQKIRIVLPAKVVAAS